MTTKRRTRTRDQDPRETAARTAFREFAQRQGWDVRARDGTNDYFEERTYYAWLGWCAATQRGGAK